VLLAEWRVVGHEEHGLAATTFDQYYSLINGKVLPTLANVRVDALTKRQIAASFTSLGGAASTRRSTYAALVRVMDFAVERGLVGMNVVREVKRPPVSMGRSRDISQAQAVAIPRGGGSPMGGGGLVGARSGTSSGWDSRSAVDRR
jgi:hypothetical protein